MTATSAVAAAAEIGRGTAMLRTVAARGCLLCGLAVLVAAAAQAQPASAAGSPPLQLQLVPSQTGTTGPAPVVSTPSARATASGLDTGGTGGTGDSTQLRFLRPLGEWSAFGRLGYQRSELQAALGALRSFAGGYEVGASVDVRPAGSGTAVASELSTYGAIRSGDWHYQLSFTRSLGYASPDLALGLSIRRRF